MKPEDKALFVAWLKENKGVNAAKRAETSLINDISGFWGYLQDFFESLEIDVYCERDRFRKRGQYIQFRGWGGGQRTPAYKDVDACRLHCVKNAFKHYRERSKREANCEKNKF